MTNRRKHISILAMACMSVCLLTTNAGAATGAAGDRGPAVNPEASSTPSTANGTSAAETVLVPQDKVTNVSAGQRFAVRLEGNAGTGYEWTYQASGTGAADLVKTSSTATTVAGGKVITTWVFLAKTAGNVRLDFALARAWETGSASATARFEVAIGEASGSESKPEGALTPGETMRVAVGDRFRVTLDANAGTGYSWSYGATGSAAATCAEPTTSRAAQLGGKETTTWVFTATKAGTLKLTFSLARPWENRIPIETVNYTVEIR